MKQMKRTFLSPLLVLLGIISIVALMGGTSLFTPLVQFIHNDTITPIQTLGCLVFTAAGFVAAFTLLHLLCAYYVPRIQHDTQQEEEIIRQG